MSAWKSLSGELDPDIRTFTDRLRQVIDRSGLGVVAVAERTRRDRADWDAYLHARRPVPRSAVVALSDITGADLGPLTAQWEHADRAWKRVLRARAVPEQPSPATAADAAAPAGTPAPEPVSDEPRAAAEPVRDAASAPSDPVRDAARAPEGAQDGRPSAPAPQDAAVRDGGPAPEGAQDAPRAPERAGGGWPAVPAPRDASVRGGGPAPEGARGGWPAVPAPRDGVRGDARAPEGTRDGWPAVPTAPADRTMRIRPVPPIPAPHPAPAPAAASAPAPTGPRKPRRGSPLLYVAGIVGAALVVTAAVLLVDLGGSDAPPAAAPAPSTTTPTPTPSLPEGVRCTGADCGGEDPERMGCGGPLAITVARTRIGGALVEVRHSTVCAAAWARISGAAGGDEVSVQAGTAIQVENVLVGETDAYTTMIPVPSPAAVRACARLDDGSGDGCTGE
ncbi:DUF2690 domain-containing protein [Streptomyces sp. NPDC004779]